MAKIAISGGIGAGKSRLAAALANRGYRVIEADSIAKNCLESETLKQQVVLKYPELSGLSRVEFRSDLANIVFTDKTQLVWLEALIHPCVTQQINALESEVSPEPLFVEVPVLHAAQQYDFLVVVTAPLSVRINRLLSRGMDQVDIQNRILSQPEDEEFLAAADFVFDGTASSDNYEAEIDDMLAVIRKVFNV